VRILLALFLLTTACESARERSIRRFVQGEILSEEIQIRNDMGEARRAAAESCGGPVVMRPHENGLEPDDFVCMPPPG
jgi:hypothetical protein